MVCWNFYQSLFVVTKLVDETVFCIKPSQVPCNVSGGDVYRLVANWAELGSCESASGDPGVLLSAFSCLEGF